MKRLILIFVLVTLLVTLLVSVLLRPPQHEMMGLEPVNTIFMPTEKECDVRVSSCQASVGDHTLSLSLEPALQALKSFAVKLKSAGWRPEQVVVYFSMQGMEMGLNRFSLTQTTGGWQGVAMLPVCTDRRSDWLATVFVSHNGQRYRAEFSFSID